MDKISEFQKLRGLVEREKKIYRELYSLENYIKKADPAEKRMILSQISMLKKNLLRTNKEIPEVLDKIHLIKSFPSSQKEIPKEIHEKALPEKKEEKKTPEKGTTLNLKGITGGKAYSLKDLKPTKLEKQTLKRMKQKEKKKEVQKEQKPNIYVQLANRWFSKLSNKIIADKTFKDLERDLIKANLQFTPRSYISVTILSSLLSIFIGVALSVFFLFFNIGANLPFITRTPEEFGIRFLKVIWIIVLAPIVTFMGMYIYPGLEKSSTEARIDDELPFATIHMSAISGAMIDPSRIFDIIISTKEYPFIEKEFKKLINEINIYGYDLVSALRNSAYNCPSKRLSELFNGLATTINSGGYLPEFFEKRSQTLLFEHGLEKEKRTKAAETFMDIYISIVIAAPMILMILLMMMKISGLGISLSTSAITLIMVLAVTLINIVFLTFLQLKK